MWTSRNTSGQTPGRRSPLSRQNRVNTPQRLQVSLAEERCYTLNNPGRCLCRGHLACPNAMLGFMVKVRKKDRSSWDSGSRESKGQNLRNGRPFHEGISFFYFSETIVFLHCLGLLSTYIHAHSMKVRGYLSEVSCLLSPCES